MLKGKGKKKEIRKSFTDISSLREYIRETMQKRMEGELPEGVPKSEREKYRLQLQKLRHAVRACIYGEGGEKDYVKGFIRNELLHMELTKFEQESLLPLNREQELSAARKFDILLYTYCKQYGKDGFLKLCDKYGLPKEVSRKDGNYYEISSENIEDIYKEEKIFISFEDKLLLLSDYVYEGFGHGAIDRLRDCRLDGISGGVSGLPEQFFRFEEELNRAYAGTHSYDSIFVMLRGTTVRLSFLSFQSEKELRRVTKALLKFESPGELSTYRPYMVNDMKDGSRVFACRPPFSESWAFFIRKFDSAEQKAPEELITGKGAEIIIQALQYFVGGGLHLAITGPQGSGKTTLLKALVRYINPKYNLRIEEAVFELWMRKEFPYRNILTFRETESVNLTEGLDAFRKTDGNCLMMGEIGTIQVAALMIELSQVSEQQLFTHHAMTTKKLLDYFRNALLRTGTYQNEALAMDQVVHAFQIHVLCEKALDGRRFIREISEIVPDRKENSLCLFRYEDGCYKMVYPPTETLIKKMTERSPKEDENRIRFFFRKEVADV